MGRRTEVREDLYSEEELLRQARTQKNNRQADACSALPMRLAG